MKPHLFHGSESSRLMQLFWTLILFYQWWKCSSNTCVNIKELLWIREGQWSDHDLSFLHCFTCHEIPIVALIQTYVHEKEPTLYCTFTLKLLIFFSTKHENKLQLVVSVMAANCCCQLKTTDVACGRSFRQ